MSAEQQAPGDPDAQGAVQQSNPPSGPEYLRLLLLGAAIGLPAAVVAAGFLAAVHEMEHLFWDTIPDQLGYGSPPWFLLIGFPLLGAGIVYLARTRLPGDGGHWPIDGLNPAPTPVSHGLGVAIAALGSLPFGAVVGPEAPLIALGSVVGMSLRRHAPAGEKGVAVLATAGSFAAISTLFGGPIVGGVLLLEAGVGMGAALIPALIPGFVAAAVGYLLITGLGDFGGIDEAGLTVPNLPAYHDPRILDLVVATVCGFLTAVLMTGVRMIGNRVGDFAKQAANTAKALFGGALAVGLLAILGDVLGASPTDVLFSGQASVPALVAEGSAGIVLVLMLTKGLAYAISLGAGFRGGPVFPAIFLGIAVMTLGDIVFDLSPTLGVAVGTAAGVAAMTRLMLASLVFAVLLVGINGLDATPAAVLAAAASWVTMAALDKRGLGPPPPAQPPPPAGGGAAPAAAG